MPRPVGRRTLALYFGLTFVSSWWLWRAVGLPRPCHLELDAPILGFFHYEAAMALLALPMIVFAGWVAARDPVFAAEAVPAQGAAEKGRPGSVGECLSP